MSLTPREMTDILVDLIQRDRTVQGIEQKLVKQTRENFPFLTLGGGNIGTANITIDFYPDKTGATKLQKHSRDAINYLLDTIGLKEGATPDRMALSLIKSEFNQHLKENFPRLMGQTMLGFETVGAGTFNPADIKAVDRAMHKVKQHVSEEIIGRAKEFGLSPEDARHLAKIDISGKIDISVMSKDVFESLEKTLYGKEKNSLSEIVGTSIMKGYFGRSPNETVLQLFIADAHAGHNLMKTGVLNASIMRMDYDGDTVKAIIANRKAQDFDSFVKNRIIDYKYMKSIGVDPAQTVARQHRRIILQTIDKVASPREAAGAAPLDIDKIVAFLDNEIDLSTLTNIKGEGGKTWSSAGDLAVHIMQDSRFSRVAQPVVTKVLPSSKQVIDAVVAQHMSKIFVKTPGSIWMKMQMYKDVIFRDEFTTAMVGKMKVPLQEEAMSLAGSVYQISIDAMKAQTVSAGSVKRPSVERLNLGWKALMEGKGHYMFMTELAMFDPKVIAGHAGLTIDDIGPIAEQLSQRFMDKPLDDFVSRGYNMFKGSSAIGQLDILAVRIQYGMLTKEFMAGGMDLAEATAAAKRDIGIGERLILRAIEQDQLTRTAPGVTPGQLSLSQTAKYEKIVSKKVETIGPSEIDLFLSGGSQVAISNTEGTALNVMKPDAYIKYLKNQGRDRGQIIDTIRDLDVGRGKTRIRAPKDALALLRSMGEAEMIMFNEIEQILSQMTDSNSKQINRELLPTIGESSVTKILRADRNKEAFVKMTKVITDYEKKWGGPLTTVSPSGAMLDRGTMHVSSLLVPGDPGASAESISHFFNLYANPKAGASRFWSDEFAEMKTLQVHLDRNALKFLREAGLDLPDILIDEPAYALFPEKSVVSLEFKTSISDQKKMADLDPKSASYLDDIVNIVNRRARTQTGFTGGDFQVYRSLEGVRGVEVSTDNKAIKLIMDIDNQQMFFSEHVQLKMKGKESVRKSFIRPVSIQNIAARNERMLEALTKWIMHTHKGAVESEVYDYFTQQLAQGSIVLDTSNIGQRLLEQVGLSEVLPEERISQTLKRTMMTTEGMALSRTYTHHITGPVKMSQILSMPLAVQEEILGGLGVSDELINIVRATMEGQPEEIHEFTGMSKTMRRIARQLDPKHATLIDQFHAFRTEYPQDYTFLKKMSEHRAVTPEELWGMAVSTDRAQQAKFDEMVGTSIISSKKHMFQRPAFTSRIPRSTGRRTIGEVFSNRKLTQYGIGMGAALLALNTVDYFSMNDMANKEFHRQKMSTLYDIMPDAVIADPRIGGFDALGVDSESRYLRYAISGIGGHAGSRIAAGGHAVGMPKGTQIIHVTREGQGYFKPMRRNRHKTDPRLSAPMTTPYTYKTNITKTETIDMSQLGSY